MDLRLLEIASGLAGRDRRILSDGQPRWKKCSFRRMSKSALKLAHVRGVALLAIAEAGSAVGEYSPLEVKASVVGYGRAEKHQVQLMVKNLLGLTEAIEPKTHPTRSPWLFAMPLER